MKFLFKSRFGFIILRDFYIWRLIRKPFKIWHPCHNDMWSHYESLTCRPRCQILTCLRIGCQILKFLYNSALLQRRRGRWRRTSVADWLAETTSWTTWGTFFFPLKNTYIHIIYWLKTKIELPEGKVCSLVHPLTFPFTQIQRRLQLQVEEHNKCLETVIAKQNESLKKLRALRGFRDRVRRVLQDSEAPGVRAHCAQAQQRSWEMEWQLRSSRRRVTAT